MAKKKSNENQLDLFSMDSPVEEVVQTNTVAATTPVIEAPVVQEPVAVVETPVVQEPVVVVAAPVVQEPVAVKPEVSSVQSFLQAKTEEAEIKEVQEVKSTLTEIAGQVKMTEQEFTLNLSVEDRFVSVSMHSDLLIITPIPEDGSLTLKNLKEQYPTFVTQIQRVSDLGDEAANMDFLEKMKNLVENKKKLGKNFTDKEIESELLFIDKLESGEIEISEDQEVEIQVTTKKSAKPKM